MRGFSLVLVLAFSVLAGCTAEAPLETKEIVVKSQPLDVRSNDTSSAPAPVVREPGQIIGVVVDAGLRPLANATVTIPGLNLKDETDRQGVFAFPDLVPSVYFLVAEAGGHLSAETDVEVGEGKAVRIRFVLDMVPPPEPRHTTTPHTGYCDVSSANSAGVSFWFCNGKFPFEVDPIVSAYVIEAVMDPYEWTGTAGGNNSFSVELYDPDKYQNKVNVQGPNPTRVLVRPEQISGSTRLDLYVQPHGFPLPESAKQYRVFVTAWYYSEPPADWSFVRGDE